MELTRQEWESAKAQAELKIKEAMLNLELSKIVYEKAVKEIAQFPAEEPEEVFLHRLQGKIKNADWED